MVLSRRGLSSREKEYRNINNESPIVETYNSRVFLFVLAPHLPSSSFCAFVVVLQVLSMCLAKIFLFSSLYTGTCVPGRTRTRTCREEKSGCSKILDHANSEHLSKNRKRIKRPESARNSKHPLHAPRKKEEKLLYVRPIQVQSLRKKRDR
jgi:hypothetical protein